MGTFKTSRGEGASAKLRRPREGNLSRKQIMEAKHLVWSKKKKIKDDARNEARKAKIEEIQRKQNKKTKRTFDHLTLRAVQDGLTSAIEVLGEKLTPLSFFMAAFTALSKTAERHQVPYMLSILSGCLPHLSQGFVLHQMKPLFGLCEQIIAEYAAVDHLIGTKAMKVVQVCLLALEEPTMEVLKQFEVLEPSKLHVEAMQMYLITFRKVLEQSALRYDLPARPGATAAPPKKDAQTGWYTLSANQRFFVHAMPKFVSLALGNLSEAPAAVATTSIAELSTLFDRGLSPYIVESGEGEAMLDGLLSHQLLAMFKPVHQSYWGLAATLLEGLFNRLHYLKRVVAPPSSESAGPRRFTERFPSVVLLVKVLNKLRGMDDVQLNGPIERALVAIGKGMTVGEFVQILPFDPRAACEAEMCGNDKLAEQLWSTSYTLNVIRRMASHDSLPYLVETFFPFIQFSSKSLLEAERAQRPADRSRWTALLVQYWRVVAGFCHYPLVITNDSFRELFKQLVGLLSSPTFVDTCATAIHVLCGGYYQLAQEQEQDEEGEETEGEGEGRFAVDNDNEEEEGEDPLEDDLRAEAGVSFGTGGWRKQRRQYPRTTRNALEEDNVFLSMNDPGWAPHRYHGISQARAKEVCETIFAKYSANIMPKLCNTFETHNSTAVLRAIESFSKVCSASVMTNILNGILDVSNQIASQLRDKEGEAMKNGQPTLLTSRRRMVLDIACAVVAQLPLEHLTTLFNDVIEPVLMDPAPESRLLQKKAYKLLFSMFEHRIKDIFPVFPRVLGILSVGRQHVTISGIKMRIRCLAWALDACKMFYPQDLMQTIRSTIGEVILFSREHSHETRELAMEILEKMQRYLDGAGAPVSTLLHLVIAGLTGKTSAMVWSAVVCMAKIVYLTHETLPEKDLDGAVAVGLQLMDSSMPEVRNAAAIFARMVLKLMKRSARVRAAVEKSLPKLLYGIALVTSQTRVSSSVRMQMRVLLEKVVKRFGYEKIEPMFPLGSKNFLRYTQKMMKREEKKADREKRRREERRQNEFDRFFMGAAMNAAGEDIAGEDLLGAGALNSFVSRHTAPSFPGLGASPSHDAGEEDEYDAMHLDFKDGKLRILTKEEKQKEDDLKRRQAMADRLLRRNPGGFLNADDLNTDAQRRPGKRSRHADDAADFENDELMLRYGSQVTEDAAQKAATSFSASHKRSTALPAASTAEHGAGSGTKRLTKLRDQKLAKQDLKRRRVEEDIRKGDEFAGRGAGDVKSGNIEPFAYVPLNRTYMNRRNNRQALHRFEVIHNKTFKGEKAKAMLKTSQSK